MFAFRISGPHWPPSSNVPCPVDILSAVNVPAYYDEARGFYRDGRRNLFRSVVSLHDYKVIEDNEHFLLISRDQLNPLTEYVLISAHADSIYQRDEEFVCRTVGVHGTSNIEATLDNSAGLTAAFAMLLNGSLPSNAILALGAEEPPHPLIGASMVSEYILQTGVTIKYAIAMDVTYDNRGNALAIESNGGNINLVNRLVDNLHSKGIEAFPAAPTRADEAVEYKNHFPAMLIACPVFGEWHGPFNRIEVSAFNSFVQASELVVRMVAALPKDELHGSHQPKRLYGVITDGKPSAEQPMMLHSNMEHPSIPGLRSGHNDMTLMIETGRRMAGRRITHYKRGRDAWIPNEAHRNFLSNNLHDRS